MAPRAQFSVLSIMLLTLCVALTISWLSVWYTYIETARELEAEQTKRILEKKNEAAKDRRIEEEFFGHFPPPILAIDLKADESTPTLMAILNSKRNPQRRTFTMGRAGGLKLFRYDLQLLRTLDKKDYYRLKWGIDGAIDQPNDQGLTTVLFEYDGKNLVLVDNEAVSIVLASKRVAAIHMLLGLRPTEEAAALKERWLSDATVRWSFIPPVRRAPNWDIFE